MKKRILALCLAVLMAILAVAGCTTTPENANFYIYFKNKNRYELTRVPAVIEEGGDRNALIETLYEQLKSGGRDSSYASPVPKKAVLLQYSVDHYNLVLNFSGEYQDISEKEEILFRASLVKTYCQLDWVNTVEIRVEDQPLTLKDGTVVGPEKGSHYINVIVSGLSEYDETNVTFYGADLEGTSLVAYDVLLKYEAGSTPERAAILRLLEGRGTETIRAIIPPDTKVLSVSTKNGTCVVDFNEAFLEGREGISPELTVYGIVNTLTSIKGITSVLITINGSTQNVFMDQVDLSQPLKRNLDYLAK